MTMLRDRVGSAFATLRKQGYVAKNGFMCCSSCAGAAIIDQVRTSGRCKSGAVFTTRQDWEYRRGNEPKSVYVKFGSVTVDDKVFGKDDVQVGHDVVAALQAEGLNVTWNGDVNTAVLVELA